MFRVVLCVRLFVTRHPAMIRFLKGLLRPNEL